MKRYLLPLAALFAGLAVPGDTFGANAVLADEEETDESYLTLVTPPADLATSPYRLVGYECSLGKDLEYSIEVGFDGDDVYVRGISDAFPDSWIHGSREVTKTGDEMVYFESDQYLGPYTLNGTTYNIWVKGIDHEYARFTDVIFHYDSATGVFTQQKDNWLVINGDLYEWHWLNNMSDVELVPDNGGEYVDYFALVTPPADLTTTSFSAGGRDCTFDFDNGDAIAPYDVNVGFSGDDCYVQGLFAEMPEAWVRGEVSTVEGRQTLTLPSPQYLGKWYGSIDCWFMAVDGSGAYMQDALVFTYDASQGGYVQAPGTYVFFSDAFDEPSPMSLQMVKALVLSGTQPDGIRLPSAVQPDGTGRPARKLLDGQSVVIRSGQRSVRINGVVETK